MLVNQAKWPTVLHWETIYKIRLLEETELIYHMLSINTFIVSGKQVFQL